MKNCVLVAVLCLTAVTESGVAGSSQAADGTLRGTLYNGSLPASGRPGVADAAVVLHKYVDGKDSGDKPATAVTDAGGRFTFEGLAVGKRYAYYPSTRFAGVEYDGTPVSMTADTLDRRSDIVAFETTRADSAISVPMHHLVVTPGAGKLQVKEILLFTNRGRNTYVGKKTGERDIVLDLEVPAGAEEVKFGGDLMSCCAVVADNHVFDTMAFKPGMRQEILSYLLPYEDTSAGLEKQVVFPTQALDIFLPEGTGVLKTPGFESQGAFAIRGRNYQRYTGTNLNAGTPLRLAFSDLPTAPKDWRWLAPLAFGLLVIGSIAVYRWWRRSKAAVADAADEADPAERTNDERQRLLDEILQLDDAYEAGSIDGTVYTEAREKLTSLVLGLENQPGGGKTEMEDASDENG